MITLHDDPVRAVPKQVLITSLFVTVVLVVATYLLGWPTLQVLIGFWVGVIINLIGFRLMVLGTTKLLDKKASGTPSFGGTGFLSRLILYGICLYAMAQIGFHALIGAAIGLSMVGFVLKLAGFFPKKEDVSKSN